MQQSENSPYIFISYAREDGSEYAKKLKQSLESRGYKVFLDLDIVAGVDWQAELEKALRQTTHLIIVLTPGSNDSEYVKAEVTTFRDQHKPVIPLYFQNVELINLILHGKQYVDFREVESYEQSFQNLVRDIEWHHNRWKTRPFIELGIHKSDVKCIRENASINAAHEKMHHAEFDIRHLVVTENGDAGGKLLGLLSLRQIRKNEQKMMAGRPFGTHVKDIMSEYNPVRKGPPRLLFNYLTTKDTVETLLNQFLEKMTIAKGAGHTFYMSAMPIVDDKNNAVGIISFKDICSAIRTRPQDLPMPSTTLVADIMNKVPVIASNEATVKDVKVGLIGVGQRDAFIVSKEEGFLGMIPDDIMIDNEVANPDEKADNPDILVPVGRLHLQSADTTVLKMLDEYTEINAEYFYFSIVDSLNAQPPPKLLGAVSYIEVFKALLNKVERHKPISD